MRAGKKNYFDFIYVDGSHRAPDVLCDAVLGFKLPKVGGFMAFDDYLQAERAWLPYGTDPLRCPKPAIDAYPAPHPEVDLYPESMYQIYVRGLRIEAAVASRDAAGHLRLDHGGPCSRATKIFVRGTRAARR